MASSFGLLGTATVDDLESLICREIRALVCGGIQYGVVRLKDACDAGPRSQEQIQKDE